MHRFRLGRLLSLAVVLTIGVAACSTQATVTPTTNSSAATSPTSDATEEPTGEPSPNEGTLCAHEFTGCQIPAGTYSTEPFEHPFEFTVTETWTNNRAWPHGGEIGTPEGDAAFQWASGVDTGTMDGQTVEIGPEPNDVIDFLRGFEGFTVSEPTEVTIDGVSGQQVDVLTNETSAPGILRFAEDALNLAPGEKVRYIVLDKDGATVLLIVDAFEQDQFEDFLARVEPILASITWQ